MDVKVIIGSRIAEARKAIGLSQLELAEKMNFGKSRISNWETGFRTPKLEEAKLLEKIFHIPAPYLLCLTDIKTFPDGFHQNKHEFNSIPIFNENEISKIDHVTQTDIYNTNNRLPIIVAIEDKIKHDFFSFQLSDQSMTPDFRENDLIVFNPYIKPRHNDYVLVKIIETNEVFFRQYAIDNSEIGKTLIKLVPMNTAWVTIRTTNEADLLILGVMSTIQRIFT